MQQLWSGLRQRRPKPAWDGHPLAERGYTVDWRGPRQVICGAPRCGRSLGEYVAYHALDEYGLVEDTARMYSPNPSRSTDPGARHIRPKARFSLEGQAGMFAADTRARFWCESCKKHRVRNLARLGEAMFSETDGDPFLV
jgi:hypothetical protein